MVEKLAGAELDVAAQKSTLMGTYLEPELYVLAYRAAKAEAAPTAAGSASSSSTNW
jgi:hypothetical protein